MAVQIGELEVVRTSSKLITNNTTCVLRYIKQLGDLGGSDTCLKRRIKRLRPIRAYLEDRRKPKPRGRLKGRVNTKEYTLGIIGLKSQVGRIKTEVGRLETPLFIAEKRE